jgi:hypothetical protein
MGAFGLEEHPKRQKTNENRTARRFPVVMIQFPRDEFAGGPDPPDSNVRYAKWAKVKYSEMGITKVNKLSLGVLRPACKAPVAFSDSRK